MADVISRGIAISVYPGWKSSPMHPVILVYLDTLAHLTPLVLVTFARSIIWYMHCQNVRGTFKTYIVPLECTWDSLNNIKILQKICALPKRTWVL